MIPLIQFDGKTNTLGEWETRKEWECWWGEEEEAESCVGLGEGMGLVRTNGRAAEKKNAEGAEMSGDIQFQVEVVNLPSL